MFDFDEFDIVPPELGAAFFEAHDMSGFTHYDPSSQTTYASLKRNSEVIGLASIFVAVHGVDVGIIEVSPKHRGQQAGLTLASHIFNHVRDLAQAGETRSCVSTVGFTDDGEAYLLPHLGELEAANPDIQFFTYQNF